MTRNQSEIRLIPIPLADEIRPGDPLADKLLASLRKRRAKALQSGDILIVKHKIVSKAEGRIIDLATVRPCAESIQWAQQYSLDARVIELCLREARAVIRHRQNGVLITRKPITDSSAPTRASTSRTSTAENTTPSLLPENPDRSAANLRRALKKQTGLAIAVIISDTFGRPWRERPHRIRHRRSQA